STVVRAVGVVLGASARSGALPVGDARAVRVDGHAAGGDALAVVEAGRRLPRVHDRLDPARFDVDAAVVAVLQAALVSEAHHAGDALDVAAGKRHERGPARVAAAGLHVGRARL